VALVLWDASALAKRFVAETGSPAINALFSAIPRDQMVTTIMNHLMGFRSSSTVTVFREGVRYRSILIAFGEAEIALSPYANDRYATPHYAAKPW
jgi:hypothetical protein